MSFAPHSLNWTPERIQRFWDFYSTTHSGEQYFAEKVGHSLLAYVSRRIPIGTAVDLGCGTGGLIGHLIERGHDAYGLDQSPASVAAARERFRGRPRFRGATTDPAELPTGIAGTTFSVEVVEHLNDDALATLLTEACRLTKPDGHLVLTTPNNERLSESHTQCPGCGATYHLMQHVRAWSAASLSAYADRFGFDTVSVDATFLSDHSGIKGVAQRLWHRHYRPHLIYIGKRN